MWSISDAAWILHKKFYPITVSYMHYLATDFLNPLLSYFHEEIISDCGKTAGIETEMRNKVSVE